MKDFRSLRIWREAHRITLAIYAATANFPSGERFGLVSQLRRCSASIGANIAEGCGKRGNPEFQRFLQIASGSASELEYHLLLSRDWAFLDDEKYVELSTELGSLRRMLTSLLMKVETERHLAKC